MAIGNNQKQVVRVVTRIGSSLDFHDWINALYHTSHFLRFQFIVSISKIASFTTIQVKEINQIPNVIEYAFHVKTSHKFTQIIDKTIEYIMING